MKGWIIFGAIFVLGVLLMIAAIVYEVLVGGADEADFPARVLGVSGIVVVFCAIYGAAAWRFHRWWRTRHDHHDQHAAPPERRH